MKDIKDKLILEYSCKFNVKKSYNDQRYTMVLTNDPTDKDILDFLKAAKVEQEQFLLDFYTKRKKIWNLSHYDICEFGLAIDFKTSTKKIYYNIDGHIYAAGINNKSFGYKYYRPMENYPKPQITKLIGKKESIFEVLSDYKPEYKEYFHSKPFIFFEERGSKDIKSLFTAKPDCYHLSMFDLGIKIEENPELIKKLLKSHNCNINNIDKWLAKFDKNIINHVSQLKDSVAIYNEHELSVEKNKINKNNSTIINWIALLKNQVAIYF